MLRVVSRPFAVSRFCQVLTCGLKKDNVILLLCTLRTVNDARLGPLHYNLPIPYTPLL